jgi:hypothetical protein
MIMAVLAGVAIAAGYRVRQGATATVVLSTGVFLWDQQTYSSHRWLALLLVTYLIFARSDSAWTLRSGGGTSIPMWPQFLMMSQLSVCYFFAAISKLNGSFLSGVPLSHWVWLPLPFWMFVLMAWATIAVELFLAVALWSRRVRKIAVALGVALHLSIVIALADQTLPLIAFAVSCLSLYPLFLSGPDTRVTVPPIGTNMHHERPRSRLSAIDFTALAPER